MALTKEQRQEQMARARAARKPKYPDQPKGWVTTIQNPAPIVTIEGPPPFEIIEAPAAPAPVAKAEAEPAPPPPVIVVEAPPAPVAAPVKAPEPPAAPIPPAAGGIFGVDPGLLEAYKTTVYEAEVAKSLAAIEQAVKDVQTVAEERVRLALETIALTEKPADVGLRIAFLAKFGPSQNAPKKPKATPFGYKDPDLMRWYALYQPDEFTRIYGKGTNDLTKQLMAEIEARTTAA